MSDGTGLISSTSAGGYAIQLAKSSAVKRSLANLGAAIQRGQLVPASSILTAFFKANPNYISTSSSASKTKDPLNEHFQALTTAISNNQVSAAQAAWAQVKTDLANDGVTNLDNSAASLNGLIAQHKVAANVQILTGLFTANPGIGSSDFTTIGGSSNSSVQSGFSGSWIGNWLTYQQGGTTSPTAALLGKILNTAA